MRCARAQTLSCNRLPRRRSQLFRTPPADLDGNGLTASKTADLSVLIESYATAVCGNSAGRGNCCNYDADCERFRILKRRV